MTTIYLPGILSTFNVTQTKLTYQFCDAAGIWVSNVLVAILQEQEFEIVQFSRMNCKFFWLRFFLIQNIQNKIQKVMYTKPYLVALCEFWIFRTNMTDSNSEIVILSFEKLELVYVSVYSKATWGWFSVICIFANN